MPIMAIGSWISDFLKFDFNFEICVFAKPVAIWLLLDSISISYISDP